MSINKETGRFSLQLTMSDPNHQKVMEILNRQGRRSKTAYIVNAILHYESSSQMAQPHAPVVGAVQDSQIEAVVLRILSQQMGRHSAPVVPVVESPDAPLPTRTEPLSHKAAAGEQTEQLATQPKLQPQPTMASQLEDEIDIDEALKAIGEDGYKMIIGAVDMFRSGQNGQ